MNEAWYILFTDFAWVMYAVSSGIGWFCFMVFVWWWAQIRVTSEIYKYFTFLLAANALSDMTALYSRTLIFINHEAYMDFVQTWIWNLRRVPETVVVCLICMRMIGRIIKTIKTVNEEKIDEKTDSRNPAAGS